MLPKTAKAMVTPDYRPIASVRVLYKLFAYPVLGRIEHTLDIAQPEEQHGFRKNRRIEEHLITANYVFDKTLFGLSVWTFQKFLTGLIGKRCGQHWQHMAFRNT